MSAIVTHADYLNYYKCVQCKQVEKVSVEGFTDWQILKDKHKYNRQIWKLLKAERTARGSCERKKLLRAQVTVISKPPTYLSGSAFLMAAYETVFKVHLWRSKEYNSLPACRRPWVPPQQIKIHLKLSFSHQNPQTGQ